MIRNGLPEITTKFPGLIRFSVCLGVCVFWLGTAFAQPMQTPYIARWYNSKDAAVSLRFDDNLKSHVRFVIPLLNKYGIKASFMVSPGKRNFKQYDDFWKREVPAMGHDLGNHTMHHRGAGNIEAADYEIGEATKLLTKLYPDRGELLLFASGGGKKWGGERWGNADDNYKSLVNKYNLIDLYDGDHPAFAVDNKTPVDDLLAIIHKYANTKNFFFNL